MQRQLAKQMKNDLIVNEETRLVQEQAQQFCELDRKLKLVEQLRDENRKREQQLHRVIELQQEARFRNVQMSAAQQRMDEIED